MTARSARGLFLTTGKHGKVERPREENDFYPTPPEPTRAFLRAEIGHLRHHGETVLRMLDRADDARQGALL